MDEYAQQIGELISTHHTWAGLLIAVITLGESLVVVGLLIPATAILLMVGGLLGTGTLPLGSTLAWAMAGAIIGDAISYALGRYIGPSILHWRLLRQNRSAVARARLFFHKHGFLAVLAGRFLGPIRSTIPTIAGIMGMEHLRFQLANTLSAILWVPLMFAPGYLTARSLGATQYGAEIGIIVGTVLSVGLGLWLLVSALRKRESPAERRRKS